MVRTVTVGNMKKIKKIVPKIEDRCSVKFSFFKGGVVFKGKEYEEYIVDMIVRAVDFGFDYYDATLLFDQNFTLKFLDIKSLTRRKNLKDVRARVIGTGGKAMNTIENLSGGVVALQGNRMGLIVDADHLDSTVQAIESLVRGAKHGNVFSYLEKQNVLRRKFDDDDLGLTDEGQKFDESEDFEDEDLELEDE